MFRPNRIGEHMLIDTHASEFELPILTADFATTTTFWPNVGVQIDSALLRDRSFVQIRKPSAQTWSLNNNEGLAFGRFMSGEHEKDLPVQINVAGSLRVQASAAGLQCDMFMGRLSSATPVVDHTALVNTMSSVVSIPANCRHYSDDVYHTDVQRSVINGLFNGGVSVFDTDPIGVFWMIYNFTGAAVTIERMKASLSHFKYTSDVDHEDPSR